MKSIELTIPKHIILETLPHPEEYGEAVVVFKNGMWTDVYTRENGEIFTITNDIDLINYLKKQNKTIRE